MPDRELPPVPGWLDAGELMRRAEAEDAAEIARHGRLLPTLADLAMDAYEAYRNGNLALDGGDYATACDCLQRAVDAGIEEARHELAEAIAQRGLQEQPPGAGSSS